MTNDTFDNQSIEDEPEERHLPLETISAYLDGQLDENERGLASTHLSICRHCQEELQSIRATTILLRSLPDPRPARSFQLGSEYVEQERRSATGWLSRLLGWMPALRTATAAVAMLLVVVIAGDVLTNQDNGDQNRDAVVTGATSTAPVQVETPTSTEAQTLMMESEAPTAPATETDNVAAAGAEAPKESIEEEGAAQEDTEVSAFQAQDSSEADESRAADSQAESSPLAEPGPPEPTATVEPTATSMPTQTPQPTATAVPGEASGTSEGNVSNWRIAEIALALLLVWLVVTLVGVSRLRKRP